jgi:hypothetical protein
VKAALAQVTVFAVVFSTSAHAETIQISPDLDGGFERVEAAVAGDEVVFAPGVYRFRLALQNSGTPTSPIVLRAQDPANPPVFDYSGAELTNWPGGMNGLFWRAAWVITGDDLQLRSIAFRGTAQMGGSPAAVRVDSARVQLSNLDVRGCSGGVEVVMGRDVTIENSRFHANATHLNLFGGGPIVVRGNLFTDAIGANLYAAAADVLVEANWFARAGGFGALMETCGFGCGGTGMQPVSRRTVLRGNVWVQNTVVGNPTFFIGFLGNSVSADGTGFTQPNVIEFAFNTVIGRVPSPASALLVNVEPIHQTRLTVLNNAFDNFGTLVEDSSASREALVDGGGSWATGSPITINLPAPITGATTEWTSTFRPLPDSGLVDNAVPVDPSVAPGFEFAGDETSGPGFRPRGAVRTIGAFEFETPVDAGQGTRPSVDGGVDGGVDDLRPAPRRFSVGCMGVGPECSVLGLLGALRAFRRRRG